MSDRETPADWAAEALKGDPRALDSRRAMRTHELKLRIERADYDVDPRVLAEAMLRHAISHRRWWNPVAACSTPPADSLTSGAPEVTLPIHVNGTADSAAERSSGATQTQSS